MPRQKYRLRLRSYPKGVAATPVLFLSLLLPSGSAVAQQNARAAEANNFAPEQIASALKTLSNPSNAVIDALSKFNPVPITQWRYHSGDLPNGASVSLDDSSWESSDIVRAASRAGKLPSDQGIVWLRKWIEIPKSIAGYDLTGDTAEIRVQVHAWGGDGALLYVNGKPMPQVDPSEPSIFYEKPGDRVLIAIRIGWTATPVGFPVARVQIDFSGNQPNPEDIYIEFVSAALLIPDLSLGYQVWHVVPGKRPHASDLKVNGLTLENTFLKVTVDPATGCITTLYDKMSNFEALAPGACGNQLQTFKDTPETDDAWNIDPGTLDHVTPLTQVDSVKLVESTPLRAVIRVSRTWQNSKFVQDITLYANSDQVDVVNDIDWHETHILLKAAFPLAVSNKMATYEIPYGTIERPTTRNNSWDAAKFEVSAQRWADLSDGRDGFSLINESKYGYDCKDNVLRLTLLRSPVSPDPNVDRGHQHFSYALYPHGGDWKTALTVRHGYDYNYKLKAIQVEPHTGELPLEHSFVSLADKNVVLTAVKKAEDANGLILHFYEWAGMNGTVAITVPRGATSARLTNLMETPEGASLPIVDSDKIMVPVRPYEIIAVRMDYPHER